MWSFVQMLSLLFRRRSKSLKSLHFNTSGGNRTGSLSRGSSGCGVDFCLTAPGVLSLALGSSCVGSFTYTEGLGLCRQEASKQPQCVCLDEKGWRPRKNEISSIAKAAENLDSQIEMGGPHGIGKDAMRNQEGIGRGGLRSGMHTESG